MPLPSKLVSSAFVVFAAQSCDGCSSDSGGGTGTDRGYTVADNLVYEADAPDVPDLWLRVGGSLDTAVLEVSDEILLDDLLDATADLEDSSADYSVWLGFSADSSGDLVVVFDSEDPAVYEALYERGLDPWSSFAADRLLIVDEGSECGATVYDRVGTDDIDRERAVPAAGGACGVLAVAHSLVRKMGQRVVDAEDATEEDEDGVLVWRQDFLEEVWRASGDADAGLGLTAEEIARAHTDGDWSEEQEVSQVGETQALYDDDEALTCETLQARCEALKAAVDTGDDVVMAITGTIQDGFDGAGTTWGHAATVESATYDAGPPCTCAIVTTKTSRQGAPGARLSGVPFEPGTATYTLRVDEEGEAGAGEDEFGDSTLDDLSWSQFHAAAR